MASWLGFKDGQRVTHRKWKNREGGPLMGTVRVFKLSKQDLAQDCARAEVHWDGSPRGWGEELDLVANDLI